jgi:hypothetical protein
MGARRLFSRGRQSVTRDHTKRRARNPLRPNWLASRSRLRHHRIARIRRTLLSRCRNRQTQMLAGVIVDAPRRTQRRIFHVQLLIELERLCPSSLKLFELVVKLNAFEMLPGVRQ